MVEAHVASGPCKQELDPAIRPRIMDEQSRSSVLCTAGSKGGPCKGRPEAALKITSNTL